MGDPALPAVPAASSSFVVLRVAGALNGAVVLSPYSSLHAVTGHGLRMELARLLSPSSISPEQAGTDCVTFAASLSVLAAGRVIRDDDEPLAAKGVTTSSKLIVMQGPAAPAAVGLQAAEESATRLARIKAAANRLGQREPGASGGPSFDLENQAGDGMNLSPSDRHALVAALSLHAKGKAEMEAGRLKDALDILGLAESAIDLVEDKELLLAIDNVPFLKLDIVWASFLLGDASRLASAVTRLRQARDGFAAAHGHDLARLRVLQGGFRPELAVYVRLELLEGVAAFHGGDVAVARTQLQAARARWRSLQVDDEALARVMSVGLSQRDASRGLRFCGGDADAAVNWCYAAQQHEAALTTKREAAARAKRDRREAQDAARCPPESLAQLIAMGFPQSAARSALWHAYGDVNAAAGRLLAKRARAEGAVAVGGGEGAAAGGDGNQGAGGGGGDNEGLEPGPDDNGGHPAKEDATEAELAAEVNADVYAEYDVDVSVEGNAIDDFLKKLGD